MTLLVTTGPGSTTTRPRPVLGCLSGSSLTTAFHPLWNVRYSCTFQQPIRGVKRGIGHLLFVTLPPEVQLRSTFQRSRGIISKRLAPFSLERPGPPVSPLPRCAHSPIPSLRSVIHSLLRSSLSLTAFTHMTDLRFALVVTQPAAGPHGSRKTNHILSL